MLPTVEQLLIETCRTRKARTCSPTPLKVASCMKALASSGVATDPSERGTITVSNDYGFELLAPKSYPMAELLEDHIDLLLDRQKLERDLKNALNLSELQRRHFRAIAQIAGLMNRGFPGSSKSTGQLQISASLLFDVFTRHEPGNRLLLQAQQEVLNDQLRSHGWRRPWSALQAGNGCMLKREAQPIGFPLLVERLNNRMSNESVLGGFSG